MVRPIGPILNNKDIMEGSLWKRNKYCSKKAVLRQFSGEEVWVHKFTYRTGWLPVIVKARTCGLSYQVDEFCIEKSMTKGKHQLTKVA